MIIQRDSYLDKLIRKRGNGLIKVVTGIRRCGKSYLLFVLFHDWLLASGVPEDHLIEVALDDRSNLALRDPDVMLSYVKGQIKDREPYYILLDEVQLMREFEDVLNSFLHIPNADVYVTGSNSRFLSSDVITEFRGRGDEIRVFPLSFSEFYSVFDGSPEEAWDDYFTFGGLPLVLSCDTPTLKSEYLVSQFKKVYVSDLTDRHRIRNRQEFDEVIDLLASAVGSFTNPLKLTKTFRSSKNKTISDHTLKNYLDYLEDSFLISRAQRYDIKGKRYINSLSKYYFEDVGLRNARLGFRQNEENHIMENVLYNELRRRGYHVDVGMIETFSKNEQGNTVKKQLEVDFVATQGNQKYYLQSAFRMGDPEKREQEERSLRKIDDAFRKIIVVRDPIKPRLDEHGIMTVGILPFLLDNSILS